MLSQHLIDSLFPPDLPEPEYWERRYPPRDLPEGAEVTRFSPSPTGFLHIGGVYVATIDVDIARHSGGRYLVRLEDTDQARVTEGAAEQFAEAFAYYGTPRGAVPNYINSFAVQSWANTSTFDAIGAAKLITVPTIVIHSEKALAPSLARRFQADLNNARVLWVESSGQIDFYDDPGLIAIGADAVTRFFRTATR